MSTAALAGALISGLVLLAVATLIALAWVDDRRRENEEIFANPRSVGRGRAVEEREDAPVEKATDDTPPVLILPSEPEPTIDLDAPEPEKPAEAEVPAEAARPTEPVRPQPPGSWQIHTLRNGEGS